MSPNGLIGALKQPADPTDLATQSLRARIRERYAELYAERTRTEAALAALHAAVPHGTDPALLDALPMAPQILADAPAKTKAALIAAFDLNALYDRAIHQGQAHRGHPGTIAALLTDPRTDDDTWQHPVPPVNGTPAHQAFHNRNKVPRYTQTTAEPESTTIKGESLRLAWREWWL